MKKIIIYGTGSGASKLFEYMNRVEAFRDYEVVCFADSNSSKWNQPFLERSIVAPADINNNSYDYVVVASVYFKEIQQMLVQEYGILSNKVIRKEKFIMDNYARHIYEKKYKTQYVDNYDKEPCLPEHEKIVVYSANIGGYDRPYEPLYKDDNVDYVFFTDDKNFHSDTWKVKYVDNEMESNVLCARYYKMFAHKWFPEYRYSVWVDSKFQIVGSLREYINRYLKKSSLLCFPHFLRDTIYDEAKAVIENNKANEDVINRQVNYYKSEGLPLNHGLIDSGCLVRRHDDIKLQNVMNEWWNQIERFSIRDQISFPYVIWKENFDYDICDLYINDCCYLEQKTVH